ncbi:helix-turn-helix domain-containing protein [Bradyrhizobium sp. HKCCYLS1011]|uniref:helix-turn-helix domain-containing protein n=1 Tax=Bradyrhizobium sp. HKCCYLS1011 TaxID=3420733 RepID=UPI003EC0550C
MSLQISPQQSAEDRVVRSIDVARLHRRRPSLSKISGGFDEDGMTLSLVHLDLAVEAQVAGVGERVDGMPHFRVSAKRLAGVSGETELPFAAEEFPDPVMQRLSDALAAAEAMREPHSAILADALRLAILTRKFCQQTIVRCTETEAASEHREDQAGRTVRSLQKWRLRRVLQYIDDNLSAKIALQDLATVAGLSRMHFAAQFRAATGLRPHDYLLKRRIERAQELLKRADISLVDVALTVGFQTQAHFTTVFKRFVGDTPYQWRSAHLAQSMPQPRARGNLS